MENENKNLVLKIVVIVIVFGGVLLLTAHFCSKKGDKPARYEIKPKPKKIEPGIVKVLLEPAKPTSFDPVKAVPVLENPRMKQIKYQYQWFVNDRLIPGEKGNLLSEKYFKRADEVYCRVKALRSIYESKVVKSTAVTIGNSGPLIRQVPWERPRVPGRFRYAISASDPDGDPLTYRLVSPLDLGIQIDKNTGVITWDIPEIPRPAPLPVQNLEEGEAIEEGGLEEGVDPGEEGDASGGNTGEQNQRPFPSLVRIVFEARDTEGATATSAIQLEF